MARDEFNNVEVTNDKQLLRVEFGKTQAAEFTAKKENESPEDELNKKVVGKTIKKVTEVNVDYVNKVQTHATQTVVTSSATASTAGTVAATTAVAASTVAVVAIATVTGISVGMHDYKYDIKSFIVSSNELRYELVVYDAMISEEEYWLSFEESSQDLVTEENEGGSSAPFKLRVYNQNYDASQYVWGYSACSGTFDHLTLGDTYNIVLTENRYGGEEIFKDTFTTYVNTSITSFDIYQETDAELGTFDYYLDYVDDEDSLSNILLEFYQPEIPEEAIVSYELAKESGFKTIRTNGELDLNSEWGYRVTYTRGNELVTYKESTIAFKDYRGRKSEYRGFNLNREANFKDNSIEVTIDYEDGLGWYQDFKLIMTMVPFDNQGNPSSDPDEYYSQEIPLQSTSETQTIVLDEYEMYVSSTTYYQFTYRLTCNYRGTEVTLDEETTPFTFSDMSGAVTEFYGVDFDKKANFLNNTFKIRLDYVDDLQNLYGFVLHLFPSGVNAQYDFYLTDTNEEQTCEFNENQHWNFSFDYTYSYTITYYNLGEEMTYEGGEDFKFTDNSGAVSEFRGYTFDGTYDISTGMAEVQLDYQDDFNYLDNFVLHLLGPIRTTDGPDPFRAGGEPEVDIEDYPYAISLEKTTEVQYFSVVEHQLEIEDGLKYISALTYEYRGEEQDPVKGESQIEFTDPDALSEFRGITFVKGEANFME